MATVRDSSYKKTPNSNKNIDCQDLNVAANSEMSFNIKLLSEHKPKDNSVSNNPELSNKGLFEPTDLNSN